MKSRAQLIEILEGAIRNFQNEDTKEGRFCMAVIYAMQGALIEEREPALLLLIRDWIDSELTRQTNPNEWEPEPEFEYPD